jgi:hypothetical protein
MASLVSSTPTAARYKSSHYLRIGFSVIALTMFSAGLFVEALTIRSFLDGEFTSVDTLGSVRGIFVGLFFLALGLLGLRKVLRIKSIRIQPDPTPNPSYPLQSPEPPVYRFTSMSSRFQFAFFTCSYWRHPAASGVLACISENT